MTSPQPLSQAAKVQTAANRFALLRKIADAKLVQQIKGK
jgi:hypothetical protein